MWNIQPRLTMLPVWDRNNWHGSLWRPTYVSRWGEVRHSYKNKSLKQRHKRKVKKLEGGKNNMRWMKRKDWEWDSDGVLKKSVFDLFRRSTQEKATAAKLAANSIRVSSEWHRRGDGGVSNPFEILEGAQCTLSLVHPSQEAQRALCMKPRRSPSERHAVARFCGVKPLLSRFGRMGNTIKSNQWVLWRW